MKISISHDEVILASEPDAMLRVTRQGVSHQTSCKWIIYFTSVLLISEIRGNNWALLGCRALFGSVRPFWTLCWNYWSLTFLTPFYPNTGYKGRCFLIMLIACMFFLVFSFLAKGQLILKCPFGVFKSTKNQQNFCKDFCPSL